jgi:hypothetical protein
MGRTSWRQEPVVEVVLYLLVDKKQRDRNLEPVITFKGLHQ